MSDIPQIFDFSLVKAHKKRAKPYYNDDGFFHNAVMRDMFERLQFILSDFETILLVNYPPALWEKSGGKAFQTQKKTKIIDHLTYLPLELYHNVTVQEIENEILNISKQKYDLILMPLCLHIFNDIPGILKQVFDGLKSDGVFLANVIGENILYHFHKIFTETELDLLGRYHTRIHPAIDVRMMGDLLARIGFTLPVSDTFNIPVSYGNIISLFHDIRAMGETSALSGAHIPLRRDVLGEVLRKCEAFKKEDTYYFDVDIVTITGRSPSDKQQKPLKPGSAEVHLSKALEAVQSSKT